MRRCGDRKRAERVSAEAIAKVVKDIATDRFDSYMRNSNEKADILFLHRCVEMANRAPIVDVTTIFRSNVLGKSKYNFYDDYPELMPVWTFASVGWVNTFGNVYVLQFISISKGDGWSKNAMWESDHIPDWEEVEYASDAILWSGGITNGHYAPTSGPIYMFQTALDKKGYPMDHHWVDMLGAFDPERSAELKEIGLYDTCLLTLLQSISFMNCRNVDLVEPKRERHERKRIERLGLRVYNINVFPIGKTYRGQKSGPGLGTPLTSVRGHFAHYGPEYGRALLFGKYAGRFWIPQHARGSEEHGVSKHDYTLRT